MNEKMLKYLMLILSIALYTTSHAQSKQKSLIGESAVLMDDDLHKTLYCGNSYTYFAELEKTSSVQADKAAFIKTLQAKGTDIVGKAGFKCPECDDPSAAGCDLSVQVSDEKGLSITEKSENGKKVFTLEEQVVEYRVSCSLCEADKKKETVDAQGKPVPATTSPAMSDYHSVEQQTKCNEENMIFATLQGMKFTTGTVDEAFDALLDMIAKNAARFGFGCKLCPDGTRRCEVEVKRVDGDLREKALLPKPLVMDSTSEGIVIPSQFIRIFYRCLDCPTEKKEDTTNAADSDDDALPDHSDSDAVAPSTGSNAGGPTTGPKSISPDNLTITAKGTGQTTGNIANISVKNTGDDPITVLPQTAYIPSSGQYQPYIATIPGTALLPGVTTTIPVSGYCVDVHKPPVGNGDPMPPIDTWIPVGDPNAPVPEGTINIIPTTPVFPFHTGDIPGILNSPEYASTTPVEPGGPIITFPGTDIPVGGIFVPGNNPERFAPLIVEVFEEVSKAVKIIQHEGEYTTPFTPDSAKEKLAFTQNLIWWYTAELAGDKYEKEDFAKNLYTQFEKTTGKTVASLPAEQKEKIDSGVDDFWIAFTAVGVEAKVISNPEPASTPEQETPISVEVEGCSSEMDLKMNPPYELDMKIADEWASAEERQAIMNEVNEALGGEIHITPEGTFQSYDINRHPTSSTSFWKAGNIGGFASAYAKTWFKRADGNWEWVWGTNKLETNADGTMDYSLTYHHDEKCRAMVAGTALIRVRASSSAFDAMAGNTHLENDTEQLNFLRGTKYSAKIALEWLTLRARGRTNKSFQDHVKDDLQDQIEGQISDAIQAEVQVLADQYLGGILGEMGLSVEDIMNVELPDLEGAIEDFLGIDIPNLDDLNKFISDGIEASLNLFFVSNTYATANGTLVVSVGGNTGSAQAQTSVFYSRQAQEETSEAIKWSGEKCEEDLVSDAQPDALTIHTQGFSNMVAEAASRFGFGNGQAEAFLESMNLQVLSGICICPTQRPGIEQSTYDLQVQGHMEWYTASEEHQSALNGALESMLQEVEDQMIEELDGMSETQVNNLTEDQFEKMLSDKVKAWGEENKFAWGTCTN